MRQRHIPERTCVACRTQQPKRAMVRIVRIGSGNVVVDRTGKLAGRGAYLCSQRSCWEMGLRKGVLARALKSSIAASDIADLERYAAALPDAGAAPAELGVADGSEI
jgi:predicted RNA-binding protein YlxR (DUF448 family)